MNYLILTPQLSSRLDIDERIRIVTTAPLLLGDEIVSLRQPLFTVGNLSVSSFLSSLQLPFALEFQVHNVCKYENSPEF